jgi:endonuclease YncB( thermonuclease family)
LHFIVAIRVNHTPEEIAMKILHTLMFCSAAAFAAPVQGAPSRSESLLVSRVIDGSTIDVATVGRVTLLGIETVSFTESPARQRLAALVLKRWVRLEPVPGAATRSVRTAYVIRDDGLFVNAELVREGLARVIAGSSHPRLGDLQRVEADARVSRRGLWSARPSLPSSRYTRPHNVRRARRFHLRSRGHHSRRIRLRAPYP